MRSYKWKGPSYGRIYDSFADPESSRYEDWAGDIEPLRQAAREEEQRATDADDPPRRPRQKQSRLAALNDAKIGLLRWMLCSCWPPKKSLMRIVRVSKGKEEGSARR